MVWLLIYQVSSSIDLFAAEAPARQAGAMAAEPDV
jgi:hypothetical protein